MKMRARLLALAGIFLVLGSATACNKLRARDQLNKGVQAYKNTRYEEAIERFKNAVALDPTLNVARLYLATAYAQQYIPGADTPDNNRFAEQAIQEYQNVLARDPKNINSAKGIAYLYLQMKQFEKAKEWYRKVIDLDPNDPEAYYSVAVIDWTEAYQGTAEKKAKIGLRVDDELKGKEGTSLCNDLKASFQASVQDGMKMLEKALQLRPDYDDAMAYLNLLYRRHADLQCGDPAAREADLKKADEWVDQTMATKKAKAEKAAQAPGGITLEEKK